MATYNTVMDILNSVMDVRNSIIDINNDNMDIGNLSGLWISINMDIQ